MAAEAAAAGPTVESGLVHQPRAATLDLALPGADQIGGLSTVGQIVIGLR